MKCPKDDLRFDDDVGELFVENGVEVQATRHYNVDRVSRGMARRLADGWTFVAMRAEQGSIRWEATVWWTRKAGADGQ